MARGDKAQANAEAQRNLMNQYASDYSNYGRQIFGLEQPSLLRMLSGQGYSPQEQAAITNAGLGGVRSVFDATAQNAANRVARTRNDAGYLDLQDAMARQQAQAGAQVAAQNQEQFANEAERRREAALRELGSMYGIDVNAMSNLLGGAGRVVGSEVEGASRPGFFDTLANTLFGNASRAASGYLAPH